MPTLEWIGKDKVINHHQEVPFRVLERRYMLETGNTNYNAVRVITSLSKVDKQKNQRNSRCSGENVRCCVQYIPNPVPGIKY